MSLRTNFLRSEFNIWRDRIRGRLWEIRYAWSVRPLRYRLREFGRLYLFVGIRQRWRREKQAVANANAYQARIRDRQNRCSHLKGQRHFRSRGLGLFHVHPSTEDYNVSFHRFINNRARVICNYCKKMWWEGDANWSKAMYMVKNSSNKPSSSEIPGVVLAMKQDFPLSPARLQKRSWWAGILEGWRDLKKKRGL